MVLCYVDTVLSMSVDAHATLIAFTSISKLKKVNKSDKPEDLYYSMQLDKMLVNKTECWTTSTEKYVNFSGKHVEDSLAQRELWLSTQCHTPLSSDYCRELETGVELNSDGKQVYHELICAL
jgi:hypothetical protein